MVSAPATEQLANAWVHNVKGKAGSTPARGAHLTVLAKP